MALEKGKLKATTIEEDDEVIDEGSEEASEEKFVPMPETPGIQSLRDKLHARMEQLRRNKGRFTNSGEPSSKDELLEERRRQRGLMRDRRRKETKEKIRREEENRNGGKKGKEKEKEKKGNQTKVCPISFSSIQSDLDYIH